MKPTPLFPSSLFPSLREQRPVLTRPFASSHSQYDTDESEAIINSPLPPIAGSSTSTVPLSALPTFTRSSTSRETSQSSIQPVPLTDDVNQTYKHLERLSPDSYIFSPAAYAEQAVRNQDAAAFSRVDLKSLDSSQIRKIAYILMDKINYTKVYNKDLLDIAVKLSQLFSFSGGATHNIADYAIRAGDADAIEYFTNQSKNADCDHIARLALENGHTELAITYTQKYISRVLDKYEEDFQTNFEEVKYLEDIMEQVEKQQNKTASMEMILDQLTKILDNNEDPREGDNDILDDITAILEDQFYDNEWDTFEQISDLTDEWIKAIDEAGIPLGQYQGEFQWEASRLWKVLDTINPDLTTTSSGMANLVKELEELKESGQDPRVFNVRALLNTIDAHQIWDEEKTYMLNIRDNFENWISSINAVEEIQHDSVTNQQRKEFLEMAIKKDNLEYVQSQLESHSFERKDEIDFLFQAAGQSGSIYQYLKEKYHYHYVTIDKTQGLRAIVNNDKLRVLDVINRLNRRTALDEWTFRSYSIAAAKLNDSALFVLLQQYNTNQKDLSYLNNVKISPAVMKYLIDEGLIRLTLNYQILTNNLSPAVIGHFLKDPTNQTREIYNSLLLNAIHKNDFNSVDFLLSITSTLKLQPNNKNKWSLLQRSSLLEDHPDLLQKLINISTKPIKVDFNILWNLILVRGNRPAFIILLKERLRSRVIISDENIDRFVKDLQQRGYRELAQLPKKIELEYLKKGARM